MNIDEKQFEYIIMYQRLYHPDLLEYESGKIHALSIIANEKLLQLAKQAYKECISKNHNSIIYDWSLAQHESSISVQIRLLIKLFRQLRFLNIAPFNDSVVKCDSLSDPPVWQNVPRELSFLVPTAMIFYQRLRTKTHYEIISGLSTYESISLDQLGNRYSRFYDSSPKNAKMTGKYLNEHEFNWLTEFRCLGNLIELIGFKHMLENQNHVEDT
jgi:hypothetical protein